MRGKSMYLKVLLAIMLAAALALGGCSDGDDGRAGRDGVDGVDGVDGAPGEPGAPAPTSAVESCIICHSSGLYAVEEAHAVTGQVSYTVIGEPVEVAGGLEITFNIEVDGVNDSTYDSVNRAVVMYEDAGEYVRQAFDRNAGNYVISLVPTMIAGDYTVRIVRADPATPGYDATLRDPVSFVGEDARWYIRMRGSDAGSASISFAAAGYTRVEYASNDACIACHGDKGATFGHHTNPFHVEGCITCHAPTNPVGGANDDSSLVSLIHGIHNASSLPGGTFTYVLNDGEVWTKDNVTYPTYMLNCSVCHDNDVALDEVNNLVISYDACLACHGDMSFGGSDFSGTNHSGFTAATTCTGCHGPVGFQLSTRYTVADFHNGARTGNGGLIYDGQDISVVEGNNVIMSINGVSTPDITGVIDITWTATYNGAAVNPCNAAVAANAPIFHAGGAANTATGQVNSNLSFLRAYGIGDDWNNDLIGAAPGQPVATNVTAANTSCAANVATTSIQLTAAELETQLTRGIVALQGTPQVKLPYAFSAQQDVIRVRAFTPTYEFDVATGAVAATRRDAIDAALCLACHVGSIYQHGGNRIDNPQMCVMCHNESSNEQNVREDTYGIDASVAYDGKAGETFGLKTMLHAIHSAGENGGPLVIYRGRGIYAFGTDPADLNNWPGTGSQTVSGSTATQNHYFTTPSYPRYLNDCSACHAADFDMIPDQSRALATTLEAGAEPWNNTFDDVVRGPAAAACLSCHQDVDSFKRAVVEDHVYRNGWFPTTFEEGAKTILDAAQ